MQQPGLQGVFNSVGEMKGGQDIHEVYHGNRTCQKGVFLKSAFLLANNPER